MRINIVFRLFITSFVLSSFSCHCEKLQSRQDNKRDLFVVGKCIDEYNKQNNENVYDISDSIKFILEKDSLNLPLNCVPFTIVNGTQSKIKTGDYFTIEHLKGNKWEKCQPKYETLIYDVGIEIMPKRSYSFILNLSNIEGGYVEGTYRVCKIIKVDNVKKQLYCTFYVK